MDPVSFIERTNDPRHSDQMKEERARSRCHLTAQIEGYDDSWGKSSSGAASEQRYLPGVGVGEVGFNVEG